MIYKKSNMLRGKFFSLVFLGIFMFGAMVYTGIDIFHLIPLAQAETTTPLEEDDDYDLYQKHVKYLNYMKRKHYRDYKKAKDKYGFDDQKEKLECKDHYEKYKLYKKDNVKYRQYAKYAEDYEKYDDYKDKYQPLSKYSKYKKYDKNKYGRKIYSKYGKKKYVSAYKRYSAKLKKKKSGEADLGGSALGPHIKAGLFSYTENSLKDDPFKISADRAYIIKDKAGTLLATIPAGTSTRITSGGGDKLKIYNSMPDLLVDDEVTFEASNGDNESMIFDVNKPGSSFDHYRGRVIFRKSDSGDEYWAINYLPLEHYIWGMGEITGTGPKEYNKVMTTAYRTYGYWKIKYSTKYAAQGFQVTATASSQVYYGYDWETGHPDIREAAIATRGTIVMYKGRIAITPYSSWTDGKTRSWEDRWGSENYPWCQSVKDPYGKHPSMSTAELVNAGNHMVGMSAHGALSLADDHNWDWQKILKYYYDGINLHGAF